MQILGAKPPGDPGVEPGRCFAIEMYAHSQNCACGRGETFVSVRNRTTRPVIFDFEIKSDGLLHNTIRYFMSEVRLIRGLTTPGTTCILYSKILGFCPHRIGKQMILLPNVRKRACSVLLAQTFLCFSLNVQNKTACHYFAISGDSKNRDHIL